MDEDDSPDELINRSTSNSKGKKPASWVISDDSDDGAEESEEGESDSGDEEEDDHLDEDLNGEEDDEEEDEDAKAEEGAFGETSACLDGMSSDEDSEKCPICLNSFNSQPVATPENCEHYFCFDCILEWAKNANSCPVDRLAFNSIYLRKCYGGKVQKMITVQKKAKKEQEEIIDVDLEQTNCEVCGGSDREDRLLLCDGCDAGYHMECLTPPLDAVPVEEWFCPECVANNRHLRDSTEDRHVDSVPSSARPAASHSQSRAAGLTRAIARTQQSERVRANVNRHRITQARTSQLAPTYLIQSTWLDDTINAVVAGLNTAVYVRDFTSHVPARGRRKTRKRRSRKTSSVAKKGSLGATKVRRRKRKVRKTKVKRNLVGKKAPTPRSRIASSLGIAKDKKSSSLPTVYRPSEHTLSSMRADIGAASLSIYGDPSDLDPFVDREEDGQQDHITSLLEAKRRGISRSALRSHQPVARPVTASISRRGVDLSQSGGVVEPAPMPDLLGSILSGQSMLLMDSSDVIINRDGSLKAAKPVSLSSAVTAGCSSSGSGDSSAHITTNLGDSCASFHISADVPGTSQIPSLSPLFTPPSASPPQPLHRSDLAPRGHLSSQPTCTTKSPGLWATNGVGAPLSTAQTPNLISKVPSQSQTKKAPTKPMWVDVSVLPRIPKIKRDSSSVPNGVGGSGDSDKNRGGHGSPCTSSSNRNSMPETGMTSLAGEKNSQQSVDQQQGRTSRQAHRPRPDGAGSSSAFSNSFSTSSLDTSSPSTQTCHSSSSSAVSFRINSSGNSWQSRRLSVTSTSSAGEGSVQGRWREKADEARKRQLHRDKQMLLASRTSISKEEDTSNIYDPFNPTLSDSSSSDGEGEYISDASRQVSIAASVGNKQGVVQIKEEPVQVKTEEEEREVSQAEPRGACPQETVQQTVRCTVKVEKAAASTGIKVKREPGLDDLDETDWCPQVKGYLTSDIPSPAQHRPLKSETETHMEASGPSTALPNQQKDPSTSSSASHQVKVKTEIRSDLRSPSGDSKTHAKKDVSCKQPHSHSSETDRGRRGQQHASGQGDRQKQRDKERETSSRRSRSRERRRTHSISDSSQCDSPERKRHRPRSQSKERRRSRSVSSSSSREDSRKKKPEQRSHDRNGGREKNRQERRTSKDQRHRRSRSKSRSTSRSRERRTNHSQTQQSSLSNREMESRSKDKRRHRSSSTERRIEEAVSKRSQKTAGSSSSKDKRERRKEKDTTESSLKDGNRVNKQLGSCSSSDSKVKKEDEDVRSDRHSTSAESLKEIKVEKEIKKEEATVDICEYLPLAKVIKKEDMDQHFVAENVKEEDIRIDPVKKEACETMKCEPTSSEVFAPPPGASFPTLTTPEVADAQSHPDLNAPLQPAHSGRSTVPVKQEPQPSDSDDDFNVDLMLDNLDNTKCERTEGSGVTVKQEKDGQELKNEGEQVSAVLGAKTKTQGKRVTWNIQEPDRTNVDKSASKLALYKLKLKQEGARRPSTIQTPVENVAGACSVSNPSKTDGPIHSSTTSDGVHMQRLSTSGQAKAQEGDLSRKDKYLKKLHMQERAIEEVKLAIKPFYQRRDINKEEYKEILRKAVEKVCHSKSGEINPVKVGNLVKAYVDKYKHARKQKGSV